MKVLVTGADGLFGKDLMAVLSKDPDVMGVNHKGLDITDLERVRELIARFKPVAVIHAAAMTDVDACESRPWDAMRVNALGTQNVALACQEADAAMVYISTDYVFDGAKGLPYSEWDAPRPINVYGKSKFAGEVLVRDLVRKAYIVRTSGLYGRHGRNFIMSLLEAAQQKSTLDVVVDQTTLPTYTQDLALAVSRLMRSRCYGTYHVTNTAAEGITWFDWAERILKMLKLTHLRLNPITSAQSGRTAARPTVSVLGNSMFHLRGLHPMRSCDDALEAFLQEVGLLAPS